MSRVPTRTLLVVALGAVALTLGYWGFSELPEGLSARDSLYQSIQLFSLQGSLPKGSLPWQLEVARFLAPAALASAALVAILAFAREGAQRLRIRLRYRSHTIIAGLGKSGTAVARMDRSRHHKLIAIEADQRAPTVSGIRKRGIPVVHGDARDHEILKASALARARRMMVSCGDDSVNLEVLAAASAISDVSSSTRPEFHVLIEDLGLWAELHRLSFSQARVPDRVDFVSVPDRVAARLVSAAGPKLPSGERADRIAVYGRGSVGVRLSVHAARAGLAASNSVDLLLAGPEAREVYEALKENEPWCQEAAHARLADDESLADATVAFVCGFDEADSLAAAAWLSGRLEAEPTAIFAAVRDERIEQALARTDYDLNSVRLVAAEADALSWSMLEESATEVLAQAKHADYRDQEAAQGHTVADNPSMAPWEDLSESLRESNRLFADGIAAKLGALGATLRPIAGRPSADDLQLSPDLLEELAKDEHDRWCRDLLAQGWQYARGPKDPKQKRSPFLVGWEQLDEATKEKDRDGVRALPRLLSRVGYELVFSQKPTKP